MIVGAYARSGQRMLAAEGFALGIFGGASLAWSMANPHFGATGAPMMWLRVTPLHSALMLAVGVVTIFASMGRGAAMFNRVAAAAWLAVTVVCLWSTTSHSPGPLGFDARDTVLYGALTLYNVALVAWFAVPGRPAPETPAPRRLRGQHSDAIGSR